MTAWGLCREDYAGDLVEVWPENWPVFRLLCDIQTQWRGGGMGLIGLDYAVMYHKMDRMALTPEQYEAMEDDMRVMELAAMTAMRERMEE